MNSTITQQSQAPEENKAQMTVPLIDKQIKNNRNMPTMLLIVKNSI